MSTAYDCDSSRSTLCASWPQISDGRNFRESGGYTIYRIGVIIRNILLLAYIDVLHPNNNVKDFACKFDCV